VHLTLTTITRADVWADIIADGWWATVTLRPDAQQIHAAEAFWITPGSFAVPLLLVGVVALHFARRGHPMPRLVGWVLIVWGAFCAGLLPVSGAWVFITVGILFLLGVAADRRGRDADRRRKNAPDPVGGTGNESPRRVRRLCFVGQAASVSRCW
jgi:hypothetical protein